MALVLLHGCEQAREKLTRHRDETASWAAPLAAPSETVHLALANDVTGSIALVEREVALPTETTARAGPSATRLSLNIPRRAAPTRWRVARRWTMSFCSICR